MQPSTGLKHSDAGKNGSAISPLWVLPIFPPTRLEGEVVRREALNVSPRTPSSQHHLVEKTREGLCFKADLPAMGHWTSLFTSESPLMQVNTYFSDYSDAGKDDPTGLQLQVPWKVLEYVLPRLIHSFAKLGLIYLKDCHTRFLAKLPQVEILQRQHVACIMQPSMILLAIFNLCPATSSDGKSQNKILKISHVCWEQGQGLMASLSKWS